jgi:short-subunit dehydrogenase
MSETWILLGASSSMARAMARQLAERGAALVLAGRDLADLEATAADARLRGAPRAVAIRFDARDPDTFAPVIAAAGAGPVSAAVFTGSMPPQAEIDADPALVDTTIADSFTGPARFLTELAPRIEAQGTGTIIGIGSVAGDRGRLSNHVYGAAKAGFHTYLSGLRNRLGRAGAHVMTVKPGFTDTAMTWGVPGMFLVAAPEDTARRILRAAEKRRNILYTPAFWRIIMTIIRLVPEPVFKKTSM